MDASSTLSVPGRSSARPIQRLSCSLMDEFLGTGLSPASAPSSDAGIADDLDDMDEQDVWGTENSGKPAGEGGKGLQQAPLPPRMASSSRPGRSSAKDGSTSWISSTVNSLSSISGTLPGSSPLGNGGRNSAARILSGEATARRVPAASRMIPRMSQQHSEAPSSSSSSLRMMPQSAPLNIPHWPKLESRNHDTHARVLDDDDDDDDDDEGEGKCIPPHELLAREYARSQNTSLSVLEGAGRTLKGRDLSRVRNAVLTYTGFVE